jgi:hypothetical protein
VSERNSDRQEHDIGQNQQENNFFAGMQNMDEDQPPSLSNPVTEL